MCFISSKQLLGTKYRTLRHCKHIEKFRYNNIITAKTPPYKSCATPQAVCYCYTLAIALGYTSQDALERERARAAKA